MGNEFTKATRIPVYLTFGPCFTCREMKLNMNVICLGKKKNNFPGCLLEKLTSKSLGFNSGLVFIGP